MTRRRALSVALELALAVLVALFISNLGTYLLLEGARAREIRFVRLDIAEGRLASLAELIAQLSTDQRRSYVRAASGRGERFDIASRPAVQETDERDTALEARFKAALAPAMVKDVRVVLRKDDLDHPPNEPPPPGAQGPGGPPGPEFIRPPRDQAPRPDGRPPRERVPAQRFIVAAQLDDGTWLNARFQLPPTSLALLPLAISAAISALVLTIASIWIGVRIAAPLRRLAEASANLRPGEAVQPVHESGPRQVREAIRAVNSMSRRLVATLEGQRSLLAAIAHDLRTPITSLRLRLEFLEDDDLKERMHASLDELQSLTEAALDALRAEGSQDQTRPTDLAALIESLGEDLMDLGHKVAIAPGDALTADCRSSEIRRAVRNLIENACRYGGSAEVSLAAEGDRAVITVRDHGPGIPEAELSRVFEPFYRVEASRSRETGGHGLGLTIARTIALSHGGDLTLRNRPEGGLEARLSLPRLAVSG